MKPFGIAIVGCGNISNGYAETLAPHKEIELIGATDIDPQRARDLCAKFGGEAFASLDAALADPRVEAIVNLTIHHAHVEVIRRCLEAGKHVHTEKPIALTYAEARELVDLAKARGLVLTASPITFLGEAAQTALHHIRKGGLGDLRLVLAEVNHGRVETWHPNPVPFYEVGIVFDVAVYPLTMLTAFLGPVRSVSAFGRVLKKDRVALNGARFEVETPDYVCANLEFASGAVGRLTADFYVSGSNTRQASGIEFHGDKGSLVLGRWFEFDAPVETSDFDKPLAPLPLLGTPYKGCEWARGVLELMGAVRENRRPRASGEHAAHVVEIVCAIHQSMLKGGAVAVESDFPAPEPMDWAR